MNTRASYDHVADEYVRHIYDELRHKPLDRQLLDRFAARVHGKGWCCDMGCGPGHVTRYLHEQGAQVCGIDLSDAMVRRARELNPGINFQQGDIAALHLPDSRFSGIIAFYSLIHIPPANMVSVLRELHRVLSPGGLMLAAFHIGEHTVHLDEWWAHEVSVDFHFFQPEQMRAWLTTAGFEIEEVIERDPYPDIEHQSRRAYLLARRKELLDEDALHERVFAQVRRP